MARSTEKFRTVIFPVDILDDLAPHAVKRGISVNELIRFSMAIMLEEELIDAVLDDADELAAERAA